MTRSFLHFEFRDLNGCYIPTGPVIRLHGKRRRLDELLVEDPATPGKLRIRYLPDTSVFIDTLIHELLHHFQVLGTSTGVLCALIEDCQCGVAQELYARYGSQFEDANANARRGLLDTVRNLDPSDPSLAYWMDIECLADLLFGSTAATIEQSVLAFVNLVSGLTEICSPDDKYAAMRVAAASKDSSSYPAATFVPHDLQALLSENRLDFRWTGTGRTLNSRILFESYARLAEMWTARHLFQLAKQPPWIQVPDFFRQKVSPEYFDAVGIAGTMLQHLLPVNVLRPDMTESEAAELANAPGNMEAATSVILLTCAAIEISLMSPILPPLVHLCSDSMTWNDLDPARRFLCLVHAWATKRVPLPDDLQDVMLGPHVHEHFDAWCVGMGWPRYTRVLKELVQPSASPPSSAWTYYLQQARLAAVPRGAGNSVIRGDLLFLDGHRLPVFPPMVCDDGCLELPLEDEANYSTHRADSSRGALDSVR